MTTTCARPSHCMNPTLHCLNRQIYTFKLNQSSMSAVPAVHMQHILSSPAYHDPLPANRERLPPGYLQSLEIHSQFSFKSSLKATPDPLTGEVATMPTIKRNEESAAHRRAAITNYRSPRALFLILIISFVVSSKGGSGERLTRLERGHM